MIRRYWPVVVLAGLFVLGAADFDVGALLTGLAENKIWGVLIAVIAGYFWDRERGRRAAQRSLEVQSEANDAERRLDDMRDKRMDSFDQDQRDLEDRVRQLEVAK